MLMSSEIARKEDYPKSLFSAVGEDRPFIALPLARTSWLR